MINDFEFEQAGDVADALRILSENNNVTPLAGGTNVMVNMKRAPLETDLVVDLSKLKSLANIELEDGMVHLGAGVTFTQLLDWHPGGAVEGLMKPMCVAFAGPLIRNLATVGGNVCDASAAADLSPVLLALDASIELESTANGKRSMPIADFFHGVRQTARRPDELMTRVSFEQPSEDERWFYYKLGKRKADAISLVSVAMTAKLVDGRVEQARIALGAVAPFPIRASAAEEILKGQTLSESNIAKAAAAAAAESRPIDDFRATGEYRRKMVEVLVRRGLNKLA